jgi:hypothetical protein
MGDEEEGGDGGQFKSCKLNAGISRLQSPLPRCSRLLLTVQCSYFVQPAPALSLLESWTLSVPIGCEE